MADNPVIVALPADTWTKVATDKTVGTIYKRSLSPHLYKQTIRKTGDPAPTDDSDAALIFGTCLESIISSDAGIDVYIKPVGHAGEVRVDL